MRRYLGTLALAALISAPAFAQTGGKASGPSAGSFTLGGLAGAAIPLGGDGDTQFAWGAEAAYHLDEKIAAGVYFTTSSDSEGEDPFEVSVRGSFLTAFADYYLMPEFHLGAMVGLAIGSVDAPGDAFDDTDTDLGLGVRAGYHFMVADRLSVGPEANVLFSTAEGSDPVLNALGAVKYTF